VSPADRAAAIASVGAFERDVRLGYVVIDEAHVSPELRAFAIDAFDLHERAQSDGFVVLEAGR
jgi:hypothetical protein